MYGDKDTSYPLKITPKWIEERLKTPFKWEEEKKEKCDEGKLIKGSHDK